MRRDLADQRDVFFFYLAVISYSNSTFKVKKGEDADDSCPQNLFHSAIYVRSAIKTLADERLLASNLGISFFPSHCFGVAVKGNSMVFETYPRPSVEFCEICYSCNFCHICCSVFSHSKKNSCYFCDFCEICGRLEALLDLFSF